MQFQKTIRSAGVFIGLLAILASKSEAATIDFVCKTTKHHIEIDKAGDSSYRYRSWNLPKPTSQPPDLQIVSKNALSIAGSGVCRTYNYSFKKGNVRIEVDDSFRCGEKALPENVIGNLYVFIKDELKSEYFCIK